MIVTQTIPRHCAFEYYFLHWSFLRTLFDFFVRDGELPWLILQLATLKISAGTERRRIFHPGKFYWRSFTTISLPTDSAILHKRSQSASNPRADIRRYPEILRADASRRPRRARRPSFCPTYPRNLAVHSATYHSPRSDRSLYLSLSLSLVRSSHFRRRSSSSHVAPPKTEETSPSPRATLAKSLSPPRLLAGTIPVDYPQRFACLLSARDAAERRSVMTLFRHARINSRTTH